METVITNFFWSLAIFLSLWGIGHNVAKLSPKTQVSLWQKPVLGIATFTGLGGILDYLGLATNQTLTLLFCLGLLLGSKDLFLWSRKKPFNFHSQNIAFPWKELLLLTCLSALVLPSCRVPNYGEVYDDHSGYLPICNQLQSLGTSYSPLSLRRALTFGGQFPLQTLGMLHTNDMGGYVYEGPVITWILLLLAFNYLITSPKDWSRWFIAPILIILPSNTNNSAPTFSITISLLAATLLKPSILQGLLFGCAISLRSQCIPYVAFIIAYQAFDTYRKDKNLKKALLGTLYSGLPCTLFLLPFALNCLSQFQTPCVLLSPGSVDPTYINIKGTLSELISHLELISTRFFPVIMLSALGIFYKETRGVSLAGLMMLLLITHMTGQLELDYWLRYSWPFLVVAIIQTLFYLKKKNLRPEILLLLSLSICEIPVQRTYYQTVNSLADIKLKYLFDDENYEAQKKIPEGETILLITQNPTNINYKRNKIINYDVFPAIGTPPLNADPKEWKTWSKKYDINYILCFDFNKKEGVNSWKTRLTDKTSRIFATEHYQKIWLPKRLAFLNNLEKCFKTLPTTKENSFYIVNLNKIGD